MAERWWASSKTPRTLRLSDSEIGFSATAYLAGAVIGAVVFGYATDRLGRKRLFFLTLGVYLFATAATAFSWDFWSFCIFRSLTGSGIGGEYAYGIGAVLGMGVLLMRRYVPESPRWLLIHAHKNEAERVVREIEEQVAPGQQLSEPDRTIRQHLQGHTPWRQIWDAMTKQYRQRSFLGLSLMVSQAFFYNAIMFTYGLVLLRYYGVPADSVGDWLIPLSIGNFLGPVIIGRLFDTIGRKTMISFTYAASGILLALADEAFAAPRCNG